LPGGRTLKLPVQETCAQVGEIPAAVIEFGSPDADAEIVRIKEHLKRIGVDLSKYCWAGSREQRVESRR
jgi:hypothetical protein